MPQICRAAARAWRMAMGAAHALMHSLVERGNATQRAAPRWSPPCAAAPVARVAAAAMWSGSPSQKRRAQSPSRTWPPRPGRRKRRRRAQTSRVARPKGKEPAVRPRHASPSRLCSVSVLRQFALDILREHPDSDPDRIVDALGRVRLYHVIHPTEPIVAGTALSPGISGCQTRPVCRITCRNSRADRLVVERASACRRLRLHPWSPCDAHPRNLDRMEDALRHPAPPRMQLHPAPTSTHHSPSI